MSATFALTRRARPSARWICDSCRASKNSALYLKHDFSNSQHDDSKQFRVSRRTSRRHASTNANATQYGSGRNDKLPSTPARTRFAPSPTGYLHIGGLRTALFSYLLAKKTKGQFLLRIEDTDQKRLVPDAEERLCQELRWAGLEWDEGPQIGGPYGPYKQSERNEIYQKHAKQLLDDGSAYRCFCTPQMSGIDGAKAAYVTSGCYQDCSSLPPDESQHRAERNDPVEPFTVRLKLPADAHKRVYKDLIYGKIQRLKRSPGGSASGEDDAGIEAADTILIKSDGTPTYHFANVVDDHLMEITHVIRGTEWMASTPLHYDLYQAFGWEPPQFAHVGLLVDENKAKLSKRSDSGLVLDVRGMREQEHVLPVALCNFLALLGWSNPGKDDVLDAESLIRDFDLKFTKGNTVVRMEKLWFLQKSHVSRAIADAILKPSADHTVDALVDQIMPSAASVCDQNLTSTLFQSDIPDRSASLRVHCKKILLTDSKSYQTPEQYVDRNKYFLTFDTSEIPAEAETYDKKQKLSGDDMRVLTERLFDGAALREAYDPLLSISTEKSSDDHATDVTRLPSSQSLFQPIDEASTSIHKVINRAIWELVLPPEVRSALADDSRLHNPSQFASHLFESNRLEISETLSAETLLAEYKNWNSAFMRWAREKLSYGQPGPGIGHIMALLGYEECKRRMIQATRWKTLYSTTRVGQSTE